MGILKAFGAITVFTLVVGAIGYLVMAIATFLTFIVGLYILNLV